MDVTHAADAFFLNINVQTTLALPNSRETVLHFFEACQKQFPSMTGFFQRETGEYVLESDRESGSYQWAELHRNRFCAGFFDPPSLDEALRLHSWMLERCVYYLGVNGLDVDAFDVLFGYNLDYRGNRDQVVSEALLGDSPLGSLNVDSRIRPIEFEPNLVFAFDEACYLQGRLSVETHSNSYQIRTGNYEDEPISVYFTVRRYPQPGVVIDLQDALRLQADLCEEQSQRLVIPKIVQPLAEAIATR
jgi:hypothetical protein